MDIEDLKFIECPYVPAGVAYLISPTEELKMFCAGMALTEEQLRIAHHSAVAIENLRPEIKGPTNG